MPPPGKGVRPGFVLASDAVACRLFPLHNVLRFLLGSRVFHGGMVLQLYHHERQFGAPRG